MTKEERLAKQRERFAEMTAHENELRAGGLKYIAGIDEVGRGPLAGPVYTACVVLPEDFDVLGIDDSKKVTEKKRNELDVIIREKAIAYGIGIASAKEIDTYNILNATKLAMGRAINEVNNKLAEIGGGIELLLIDAVKLEDVDIKQESIIKGDATCLSIAAASIVAKVARDNYMVEMDEQYPGYGFASNKGYGTAVHYDGIREFGMTPIHRKTFLKNFAEKHSEPAPTKAAAPLPGKKVYAVRKGKQTGIFYTWDECKAQTTGFKGAEFKSFKTIEEANAYLGITEAPAAVSGVRAYVDGSYDASNKRYSCGVVMLVDGKEILLKEAFTDAASAELRNVAGEIMGSETAIQYCLDNGIDSVTIYHDYNGISKWANDEWKANLDMTKSYKAFVREARKHMTINFVKVEAHTGDKYNEMADKLAKSALGI